MPLTITSFMKYSFIFLVALMGLTAADTSTHTYTNGENVDLWVNKIGPYANPQETYEYYTLPYCAPDTERFNELKLYSLGERLGGHALRHSGHSISFAHESRGKSEECTTEPLTSEQAVVFTKAVQQRWFYQMYLDDLPIWGMVGEMLPAGGSVVEKEKNNLVPFIYTSRSLTISCNANQIVKVDLTSDPKSLLEVKVGAEYKFTLFVSFAKANEEFHSRFNRYLDHEFFKEPIYGFSVFNSIIIFFFFMGLVALLLLRTLKKDYARYGLVQDLEDGNQSTLDDEVKPLKGGNDDSGWKQVHGDVFRAPFLLPFFAALLGTGWQLVTLTLGVILYAFVGSLNGRIHENRGEVLHAILVCYSLSSIVSGYTSGQFFKEYYPTTACGNPASTSMWQASMGLTVVILPTFVVTVLSFLNAVSLSHGTINTIPFLVFVKLFLLWIFVSIPLCVVGTILGRHAKLVTVTEKGGDHFPCCVNAIPRPIPEDVPWYGKPSGLILLAGLLSFCSILIELYHIMTSLWNHKFYHAFGVLMGVYCILTIVVSMTSIIVVYFCLNAENYQWQWTAYGSGASTALYVFVYGVYYFLFKTQMNGFLQISFYFGYMSLISLTLGILCGTLGHAAASRFVHTIFQNVKLD